jgi:hypothetical protein
MSYFGKRNIMIMNYTRYLALPKTWMDAMRHEKGDQVKIEMDNENMPILSAFRNGRTRIFYIFIGVEESIILLEIVGAKDNPKTKRRWYDRVKDSVEYVSRNWGPLVFVWDKFFGM